MANTQYPVQTPQRWDNISYAAYGSVDGSLIAGIIAANPDVLITPVIAAGTILNIPILTEEVQADLTASLPPWMQ